MVLSSLALTFENMASKGLRMISYHVTRKVEAGYKLSQTSETLIGYTDYWRFVVFIFIHFLHSNRNSQSLS